MAAPHSNDADLAARRKRAQRSALWIGGIALLIYVVFILSGVLLR
jgi:hypothetical protein